MKTPITKAIEQIKNIDLTHHTRNDVFIFEVLNILQSEMPYEKGFAYTCYDAGVKAMNDRGVEVRALCDVDYWYKETFNQTPIEFDAKKVAEEMYNKFMPLTRTFLPDVGWIEDKPECIKAVKIALSYSLFTTSQRSEIIKCLNEM